MEEHQSQESQAIRKGADSTTNESQKKRHVPGLRELFGNAWNEYKHHWKRYSLATLLLFLCVIIIQGLLMYLLNDVYGPDSINKPGISRFIFQVANSIQTSWLLSGLLGIIFFQILHGTSQLSQLFFSDRRYDVTALFLIYDVMMVAGLTLFIVPGIILGTRYVFAPYILLEKGGSLRDAFRASAALTAGRFWITLWYSIVTIVVMFLGVVLLGVGVLVTFPVGLLAHVMYYRLLDVQGPLVHESIVERYALAIVVASSVLGLGMFTYSALFFENDHRQSTDDIRLEEGGQDVTNVAYYFTVSLQKISHLSSVGRATHS